LDVLGDAYREILTEGTVETVILAEFGTGGIQELFVNEHSARAD
jgi:hypothetical protein